MRRSLVFLLFTPLFAQFGGLATTDNGRELYFTSTLQLGSSRPGYSEYRIFRLTDAGLQLFAERDAASRNIIAEGLGVYNLQISGDGRTVALTLFGVCSTPEACDRPTSRVEIRTAAGTISLGSNLAIRMSRNARWVIARPIVTVDGDPLQSLIDLDTGEQTRLPRFAAGVASDGTVLLSDLPGLALWRRGTITQLPLAPFPFAVATADDFADNARVVIYSQIADPFSNPELRLGALDVSSGRQTVIASKTTTFEALFVDDRFTHVLGLSNDGLWLLYTRRDTGANQGQAFLANTTTGQNTRLPLPPGELAMGGALSGDGNRVFLTTDRGRILTIDLANAGEVLTLIPPTPYISFIPTLVPGSLAQLTGPVGSNVQELAGRLFLDDIAVPILGANDNRTVIQVPWELNAPGQSALRLEFSGESPFRQAEQVRTVSVLPRFVPLDPGETSLFGFKAFRADFAMLTSNPLPGDVVIAYATGLGPLTSSIRTGEPAPLDRAIEARIQLSCRFIPYPTDAETLFVGLAPGLTGIYQVNFRLPSGVDPGSLVGGQCSYNSAGTTGRINWINPRRPPSP